MSALQVALVVLGTLWVASHLLIASHTAMSQTRDRILTGRTDEGVAMTPEHRRLLYRSDWAPLHWGVALLALPFAGILVALPWLAADPGVVRPLCWAAAVLPLLGSLGTLRTRIEDRRQIRRALKEDEGAPPRVA
jgi:hypothetical protein